MQFVHGHLTASPTDLANFLGCRHKTALDRLAARGQIARPAWVDPFTKILQERGDAHEARYLDKFRADGLDVVDLGDVSDTDERLARTLAAIRAGVDVIAQGALRDEAGAWFGYPDVLRKVDAPSSLGPWSYEVHDTKLTRETRGGTILQLCVYTDLVEQIQSLTPERFVVVTPLQPESYRVADFAAFYREIRTRFREFVRADHGSPTTTCPDPVDHCAVCRWWQSCDSRRRQDDHLSFVAGLGHVQQTEFMGRGITTVAGVGAVPVPLEFRPKRGSKDTYERLIDQARLQLLQRESGQPTFVELPIEKDFGLTQLPEPRPGDLFLDLEGDPFARPIATGQSGEGNRDYLFGLGRVRADGSFEYLARWAFTDAEEREAFEAVMSDIVSAFEADPGLHVYHYAAYEASAFRRLVGRYGTREIDLDRLLRGRRFIDLFAIARHAIRAGVERYSIKDLEPFYGFARDVELDAAGNQRRIVETALETNDLSLVTPGVRKAVEGYNQDDCRSLVGLRGWLESIRSAAIGRGMSIPRPPLDPGEPTAKILERDQRAIELRSKLLTGVPDDTTERSPDQQARYLLAYLVDWHRREERVAWGEFHRVRLYADEDLIDEPQALAGLRFMERVSAPAPGSKTKTVVDRYSYPVQENDIREGDELRLRDDTKLGAVEAIDKAALTIDIKKSVKCMDVYPDAVIALRIIATQAQEEALQRIAKQVIEHGLDLGKIDPLVVDVLQARSPRVRTAPFAQRDGEDAIEFAKRTVFDLDGSLLAIQGPPGSGKTYTGAQIITALAAAGRKVGVVATGHKVIRKLLIDTGKAAKGAIALAHKPGDHELDAGGDVKIEEPPSNEAAFTWLTQPGGRVLGGTSWLWAREEFTKSVDVLFVDEAGQMSLANTLAVAPAAKSLVLLGDPQQLDQPQQGSHPDGVDVSALDHILAGHQTMPEGRGIFLPTTWRLAPAICRFTSEVFYEGRLVSKPGLERQRLAGSARFSGAGLFVVEAAHDGCRSASAEEVDVVASIVTELVAPGVTWRDETSAERQLTPDDILIVAPFNAQVSRLQERLTESVGRTFRSADIRSAGFRVGTVDRFQGQEAPVVIYSMTTSRPEDAPRGMEFLYSPNRLNVATSRAKCACILVASPHLFEPECKTPRQMRLANALCRYRELAGR